MAAMNAPAARPAVAALKGTLIGGIASSGTFSSLAGAAQSGATLRGAGPTELARIDIDATIFQDEASAPVATLSPGMNATSANGRTTVLPRRNKTDEQL